MTARIFAFPILTGDRLDPEPIESLSQHQEMQPANPGDDTGQPNFQREYCIEERYL